MTPEPPVLSRRLVLAGVLCVVGICGVLFELAQDWTLTLEVLKAREPVSAGTVAFRTQVIRCFGLLGWLGSWCYLGACVWLPVALVRIARGRRDGHRLRLSEACVVAAVAVQLAAVPCAFALTDRLFT